MENQTISDTQEVIVRTFLRRYPRYVDGGGRRSKEIAGEQRNERGGAGGRAYFATIRDISVHSRQAISNVLSAVVGDPGGVRYMC